MEIFPVHAGDGVARDDHPQIPVERVERGAEDAGVRVDPGDHHGLGPERAQQHVQVGSVEGAEALLAPDHEVAGLGRQLRGHLRLRRALLVVVHDRAAPPGGQRLFDRFHGPPERVAHALQPRGGGAAVGQEHVDDGDPGRPRAREQSGQRGAASRGVGRLHGHGADLGVEVPPVHIHGEDRGAPRIDGQLAAQRLDELSPVEDLGHRRCLLFPSRPRAHPARPTDGPAAGPACRRVFSGTPLGSSSRTARRSDR